MIEKSHKFLDPKKNPKFMCLIYALIDVREFSSVLSVICKLKIFSSTHTFSRRLSIYFSYFLSSLISLKISKNICRKDWPPSPTWQTIFVSAKSTENAARKAANSSLQFTRQRVYNDANRK